MRNFNKSILLLFSSLIFLSVYFIRVNPLSTNDTYYHLAVGREVIQTHQMPQKDNFVYGSANTEYVSSEWLSGALFYLLVNLFGLQTLLILRVICGLLTVYFLFRSLRLININPLIINVSVLFGGYLLAFRLNTRPEMFSLVFLSMVNYTCLHFYFKKSLSKVTYFLPIIFLLWPNLHGFSSLGIFLLTFFSAFFLVQIRAEKLGKNVYHFLFIYVLIFLVSIVQHQRVLTFLHVNSFSQYITEWVTLWQRVFPSGQFTGHFYGITTDIYIFLVIFVVYTAFIYRTFKIGKNFQIAVSIFYFLLLLLPFKFYRLITPIIIISIPYFIFSATQSLKKAAENKSLYLKILYIVLLLVIAYSALIGHQLGGERVGVMYPDKTMEFIKSNLKTSRLFTIYFWNDYFIWNIPQIKTFSDVMTQYRILQDLEDERKLHSPENDIKDLVIKYDIDTVVSTRPNSANIIGASLTPVYNIPGWKLVYLDNFSVVYAKKDIIKNNVLDLSLIHPEFQTPHKYKLEDEQRAVRLLEGLLKFDNNNDFARSQLIYYYFVRQKDFKKAKSLAEESKKLVPENPFYSFILSAIYFNQNDCKKAQIYARESLAKNSYDADLKNVTNNILGKCL